MRRKVPVSSARNSRACTRGVTSPTSSRQSVPPSATSKSPCLRSTAPVKAPFSWPNSSLCISSSESEAQSTTTNGFSRSGLAWCSRRAISSFPVPVSPEMSTLERLCAARSTAPVIATNAGERPIEIDPLLRQAALEDGVALLQPPRLQRALHRQLQLVEVAGLEQVVGGAGLERADGRLHGAVAGEDDHLAGGRSPDALEQREPVLRRQPQVHHQHVGLAGEEALLELRAVLGLRHAIPRRGQLAAEAGAEGCVVVDHQHVRAHAAPPSAGSETRSFAPAGTGTSSRRPPCASTICRER